MASVQYEENAAPEYDDHATIFYIGQHESKRALPVSEYVLEKARNIGDTGYDMLTTPITTPFFQSRVLTLLSNHLESLSHLDLSDGVPPAPIIPPLTPVDTPLTPGSIVPQLIGYVSPWIDLCSPDPVIVSISHQVLTIEVAYASFCGISNIIIPGPNLHPSGRSDENDGIAQYGRAIQEALTIGAFVAFTIHMPMYETPELLVEVEGSLASYMREEYEPTEKFNEDVEQDLFGSWDHWNLIRSVCKYNTRLSVALAIPRKLPVNSLQSRWFSEPLRLLSFTPSTFLPNKRDYPVLSKPHQALITRYMKLKQAPWLLLSDVGPIPNLENTSVAFTTPASDGFESALESLTSQDPTPAEASSVSSSTSQKTKFKDPVPHLSYLKYLQRNQPPKTMIEKFGSGYQDYLQSPLQPLTDNLESVTYEVFEKDPVKYDQYEIATIRALASWHETSRAVSGPDGAIVIAVTGAGRGPLVTRALRAAQSTGVKVEVWAVEKNPNAYVLLQRHNQEDDLWGGQVNIVKSDMRAWKGPHYPNSSSSSATANTNTTYGKVDIIISELLGSFADNELSPECLDGVQHVLSPTGLSIPSSYTAHISPISAPRIHADISHRSTTDPSAPDTPYVVLLHQIDFLASNVPTHPYIQQTWEFVHPLSKSVLEVAEARRMGGVSGGGGGSMAGGDGANEHNSRRSRNRFVCLNRGVVHGLAGYFEAVLWDGEGIDGYGEKVELSTRPDPQGMEEKSKDMISWFPIFFPLKNPLYFPDDAELEVSMWRQTDDRKVWYEWMVEAWAVVGPNRRVRVGVSEVGTSRKVGCLM